MTKKAETDLSLVSTDALWDELSSRNDACVFAYVQDRGPKTEDAHTHFKGSAFACLGLAWLIEEGLRDFVRSFHSTDTETPES